VLRLFYGMRIVWAEQSIEARLPDKIEREALELGAHEPVLSLTRTTFNDRDLPIEFVTSVYCGSSYQFRTILWRADSPKEARK
jgi:GntR family transcriptional regulator